MKNAYLSELYYDLQTLHVALKADFLISASNVKLHSDFSIQSFKYNPSALLVCDFGYGAEDGVRIEINGKEYFGEFRNRGEMIKEFATLLARALHYTGNTYCDIAGIVGRPMLAMLIAGGHTEEVKTWRMK